MKNLGCFKDFKVRPLDGAFDARTPSGELNFYDFRVVLNMDLTDQRKRCRMGGWQRLLADSPFGFNNQDLHDQMLGCQTYYESFDQTLTYGPVLTGYTYPVWYPGQSFPDQFDSDPIPETYYGYPPDFYGDYPYYPALGPFICESYIGYPYNGDGDSYFELCYGTIIPAYSEEGYGSGTPIPTYIGPYTYDYNYCGDYAFNRDHLCREAITLLYEAVSVGGRRKLLAGTKSRLYVLNERSGNWRILLDGQSGAYAPDNCECAQRRFEVAQVGNIVLITNNFDPVMTWEIDAGPSGCDLWSTEFVPDLQGLGIQKAGVVASWQGFAFLADVQVNNEHQGSRIYWSDLNDPRSWAPGGGSAAGFVDLGLGERVVAISPIGGQLRVYTTRGDEKAIYNVSIVGGTEILSFNEIYRGPDGIEYENSLVNTGGTHVWLSSSGIMVLGEYDRTPQRIEWIYKADGVFYNGLPGEWLRDFDGLSGFGPVNKDVCHNVVGGYNSERKQIWFSWPTDENTCANMSLVINPVYRAATLVDHGFTAFLTYRPDYTVALRDFLAQYAGCDPSTMVMPKEGEPLPVEMGYMPAYIRNETEDPDLPPDDNSMCGYLGGLTLEDLCEACGVESLFVMASALDKTLKEFTPNQCFRERFVEPYDSYIEPEPEPEPEPDCTLSIFSQISMEVCYVEFTSQPEPATEVEEGEDIELEFAYVSIGGPYAIQWYKDDVALVNGATGNGSTIAGVTTTALSITNAAPEDTGTYHAVVSNGSFSGCTNPTNDAEVIVNEAPTLQAPDAFWKLDEINEPIVSGQGPATTRVDQIAASNLSIISGSVPGFQDAQGGSAASARFLNTAGTLRGSLAAALGHAAGNSMSLSFWIKFEEAIQNATIPEVGYRFTSGTDAIEFNANTNGSNDVLEIFVDDGADSDFISIDPFSPTPGQWYMWSFIYDQTTGLWHYYVDTTLIASTTVPLTYGTEPTGRLELRQPSSSTKTLMSQFAIWTDYKLTTDDLTTLYNAGAGITCCPFA